MREKLNVLIVDDELNAQQNLCKLIEKYCQELHVVICVSSAEEARRALKDYSIDVIFLDIAMPDETGFDLIESIEAYKYAIVFVTAFDNYVLKALRASAVDYLQKPIDIDELKAASNKVWLNLKSKEQNTLSKDQQNSIDSLRVNTIPRKGVQRLCLPGMQGFTVLDVNDIVYLDADSNYTIFHLTSLTKVVVAKSIKEYEDLLDPHAFFRIHKSSIIHLKYLVEFSRVDGYYAIMSDKSSVPISRRRLPEFMAAIDDYNQ